MSTLVPAPYKTWQDFFHSEVDEDVKLIVLERWIDGLRGHKVQPEPRYNSYLATEIESRTAWEAYRILRGLSDDVFPADRRPKTYEGRGDAVQLFRPTTNH